MLLMFGPYRLGDLRRRLRFFCRNETGRKQQANKQHGYGKHTTQPPAMIIMHHRKAEENLSAFENWPFYGHHVELKYE